MRSYAFLPLFVVFATAASCQTDSPQQQHAADQAKCTGYGYQIGTDQFANCMMKLDSKRENQAASQQQSDANMKALSIKRNGDTRFPVCSASNMDANLDTMNNAWYGPDCREK